MATNHTTSIAIKHGVNTQGFFSFEQPENLIVFVHGFGGNAISTWNNFSSSLIFDDHFKKSDIIFYGYNTFKGSANDHATQLYHFLNLAVNPLLNDVLPMQQKLPDRNYQRIVFVAHSLGAVLVRQAQLLAEIAQKDWVNKSSLALFAPAHNGVEVIALAMQTLPGLSSLLGIFARLKYPILNDLDVEKGGILKDIRDKTKELQDKGKADFAKARLVVHAMGDKIIIGNQYLLDNPAEIIENSTHTAVCKPNDKYLTPFELIKKII
ncbi:hypothetical protein BH11BAC7_BH11BAC7_07190 [soil metagenome]